MTILRELEIVEITPAAAGTLALEGMIQSAQVVEGLEQVQASLKGMMTTDADGKRCCANSQKCLSRRTGMRFYEARRGLPSTCGRSAGMSRIERLRFFR